MPECSFCGDMLEKGTGLLFVQKTGKKFYFCSSKCRKNSKLGREGRRQGWTKKHQQFKEE